MSTAALSSVRVLGMPIVTKSTSQFLFSLAVLIAVTVLLVTKSASSTELMPIMYVVMGHFFGTQTGRTKWPTDQTPPVEGQ